MERLTLYSHCPWIDNCVGANNLRHFVLYIVCLEVGIILFVQLTYSCKFFMRMGRYALLTDDCFLLRYQPFAGTSKPTVQRYQRYPV